MYIKLILTLTLLVTLIEAKDSELELGLGVGSVYYPNYIGSKSTQTLSVPVPYIRYRGEYFRIDEDGINGKLFGINGLRVDLSVNGSLPASSDDSGVRKGMPDLDLTGEIGPNLIYNIYEHGVAQLEFELPVRAVLSTDFSNIKYRGVVSTPQLKYSLNYSEVEWTLRAGVIFGDEEYNNYFYEVKDKYVTPLRALYKSNSGFGGYRNRIGMTYSKNDWWAGAFVSYTNIDRAVFKGSPLVETSHAFYMGVSIAYILYGEE